MSPEIHYGREYNGSKADIIAAGTILFIMISGHPPFNTSEINDKYYRDIAT